MAIEIKIPEISDGITTGTIISLSVSVGDQVNADQTLLELETDKAVVEIPSPKDGKISEIKVSEGDEVNVGAVIMLLETGGTGKEYPAKEPTKDKAEPKKRAEEKVTKEQQTPQEEREEEQEETIPEEQLPPSAAENKQEGFVPPSSPSVRRLARELGVDIYQVQGTRPKGRISAEDVRNFVHDTMQQITGGSGAPSAQGEFPGLHAQRPLPDFSRWGEVTREPISKIREVIADSMSYGWSTIPMVTQYDRARITEVEAFRKSFNQTAAPEDRLTMTVILVKVCAAALKTFPDFNSSIDLASRELILKKYVHIGVAVDTPNGLLVPVVHDADRKGLEHLAGELNELAVKARQRKIAREEMEGGTFTISNLGGIGGTAFTPIVYAPQVAILGVSAAEMQPAWNGQDFVPCLTLPLSLTYDHRVIDGADGARFLRWICEALETPLQLVMSDQAG